MYIYLIVWPCALTRPVRVWVEFVFPSFFGAYGLGVGLNALAGSLT